MKNNLKEPIHITLLYLILIISLGCTIGLINVKNVKIFNPTVRPYFSIQQHIALLKQM